MANSAVLHIRFQGTGLIKRLIIGTLASLSIFILPALLKTNALRHSRLWILTLITIIAQLFQPTYKPIDKSAPKHDRSTAAQIVWSVYLTQLMGVIEAVYYRYPESFQTNPIDIIAFLLMLVGLGFRTWSIRELGRFFTWHITVQPGQTVIQTGPYSIVRHPAYAGALLMYSSTLIFIHSWVAALIAPIVIGAAFLRRIHYEEAWLKRYIGYEYDKYSRQVKKLIPFVW